MAERLRLDQMLVARGHFPSRARARDAVERGCVQVDGAPATKPGQMVPGTARLTIADPAQRYVARSALKLVAALDAFGIDPAGLQTLDVGQSTGGFTQVLLERGAAHVTGVDVGTGQLDPMLSRDPRVTAFEGVNARDGHALPPGPFDLAVIDVSFIALALVLPSVLARVEGPVVALFKPQFEVGRAAVGKGGLVRDEGAIEDALHTLTRTVDALGWRVAATIRSPIAGGDGNVERLVHLVDAH